MQTSYRPASAARHEWYVILLAPAWGKHTSRGIAVVTGISFVGACGRGLVDIAIPASPAWQLACNLSNPAIRG
jgi:hypothetical protein